MIKIFLVEMIAAMVGWLAGIHLNWILQLILMFTVGLAFCKIATRNGSSIGDLFLVVPIATFYAAIFLANIAYWLKHGFTNSFSPSDFFSNLSSFFLP